MDIDVTALKQFQTILRPIVNAIPALLDAASKEADFNRALAQKAADLETATTKVAEQDALLAERLASAQEQVTAAQRAAKDVRDKLAEDLAAARIDSVDRLVEAKAALAAVEGRVEAANLALRDIEGDYEIKRSELQAEHDVMAAALQAELNSLTTRKEEAASALDAIRSKLG